MDKRLCFHRRETCLFCWPDDDGRPPIVRVRPHFCCPCCGRPVGTRAPAGCCGSCTSKGVVALRLPGHTRRRRRRAA